MIYEKYRAIMLNVCKYYVNNYAIISDNIESMICFTVNIEIIVMIILIINLYKLL